MLYHFRKTAMLPCCLSLLLLIGCHPSVVPASSTSSTSSVTTAAPSLTSSTQSLAPTTAPTVPAVQPDPSLGIYEPPKTIGGFAFPAYHIPYKGTGLTSPQNTDVTFPARHNGGSNSMADFIGANHIWGGYTHLGYDGLTEGGIRMQQLGSKTIKVYLVNYYEACYPVDTDWGEKPIASAVELAQHEHFRALFDLDLDTYVLGNYIFDNSFGHPATYFLTTWNEQSRLAEYQQMYDLVYYLCKTYEGTGKSFIIQNWESDWACMPSPDAAYDPPQAVFDRLIQWINTRQDAVMAARRDAGCENVYIYNALEVNLVDKAMQGKPCVTNNVIPYTYCDFYCYSAYDTQQDAQKFAAALDYLRQKADSNRAGGRSRLYIGECGYPDLWGGPQSQAVASNALNIAREKGYSHIYWWSLFEPYDENAHADRDFSGMALVSYSGRLHRVWNMFYKAIHGVSDPHYVPGPEEVKPDFPLWSEFTVNGETNEHGMTFCQLNFDGWCSFVQKNGRWCTKTEQGNIYYKVSSLAVPSTMKNLKVTITYFDNTGPLELQYNNSHGTIACVASLSRTNTQTWKTHTFHLTDAGFDDLFHQGFADMRLFDCGQTLYVSRVEITA